MSKTTIEQVAANMGVSTKKTRAEEVRDFAVSAGYTRDLFNSRELNSQTTKVFNAYAKGELSLWDLSETLWKVSQDISAGLFKDADNIKSFRAYCIAIGLDVSNMSKYVRAWEHYSMLKSAGFSVNIAVALIGSGIDGYDFIANHVPAETTVKAVKEEVKRAKNTIETSFADEDTSEKTEQEDNAAGDTADETTKDTSADGDGVKYVMSYNVLCALIQYSRENADVSFDDIINRFKAEV